jgi:N-acetylmuramoyl-L-alanine amidase
LYTRDPNADQFVSLEDRAAYANSTHADLFISIHHDSNDSSTPSGFSIHYSSYRPGIEVNDVYVDSNGVHYPYIKEVTAQKYFIVQDGSTTKNISYLGEANAIDPTPSQPAVISKELANLFSSALVYRGGTGIYPATMYGDNGVRDANLYVTRWTTIPSVLCELGFISNPAQVKLLADPSVQDARAQALANSIRDYFNK